MTLSTIPFPGDTTSTPKDIIEPNNPDSGGSDTTNTNLDGSDVSIMLGGETKSGIWWWCIAYNKQTLINLDFVYSTQSVLFDWHGCNLMLQEFVDSFIDGNSLTVSFLTLPYVDQLEVLTTGKEAGLLTDDQYIAKLAEIQNLAEPVEGNFTSLIDSSNVYSLVSFRRLLNPEEEYLEHKTEIDAILEEQFTFDLIAMDRATNGNNSIQATLNDSKSVLTQQLASINRAINLLGVGDDELLGILTVQKLNTEEQLRKVNEQIDKLNNGRF